jgi:hypothetical protein
MPVSSRLLAIPAWSQPYSAITLINNHLPEVHFDEDGIIEVSSGQIQDMGTDYEGFSSHYGIPDKFIPSIQESDAAISVYTEDDELAFVMLISIDRLSGIDDIPVSSNIVAVEYFLAANMREGGESLNVELYDVPRNGFCSAISTDTPGESIFESVFNLDDQDKINEFYEQVLEQVNDKMGNNYPHACGYLESEFHSIYAVSVKDVLVHDDASVNNGLANACMGMSLYSIRLSFNLQLEVE